MSSWTRATTIAGTLADRYGLERWALRNVVLGIAARPDLYALAVSAKPEDKDLLGRIVDDAQEAAKSRSGANLGTALHRLTERIDRGEILDVPDAWKPDIDAYAQTVADNSIKILPEWIERVVIAPQWEAAGTLDRLVHYDGRFMVADLKTGQNALAGAGDIAVQLAIYANSTHAWIGEADKVPRDRYGRYELPDPATDTDDDNPIYEPLPDMDRDRALVIHLPVGKGVCQIHEIDIKAGREAIDLALAVRDWRKRDDLHSPISQWKFSASSGAAERKEVATVTPIRSNYDW